MFVMPTGKQWKTLQLDKVNCANLSLNWFIWEPVVACSVAVGSAIVGSFVIGVGSVVICSLLQLTNICQHIFNVRRISYKQIPGMESPQCHFQNWGSPIQVEWKGLLSKFLVFSQKLYYSKLWHILDLWNTLSLLFMSQSKIIPYDSGGVS